MSDFNATPISSSKPAAIRLRRIGVADVVSALRLGYRDFMRQPSHHAFLCLIYPVMGLVIAVWTSGQDALPLLYPLVAGFALLGPIAALGLYEISRRRELGLDASWRHAFDVVHAQQIRSIVALGLVLVAIFFAWLMSAHALYAWAYKGEAQPLLGALAASVLTTSRGWTLLFFGNAVGFLFALVVLSISVVAFPMMLDRPVGFWTAMETSVRATRLNPVPVLFWGAIVGILVFIGSLPLLVGLAVVLPILGHATWHLYRSLVA